METLGTPTQEDLSFVTDQTALNYLNEFPKHEAGRNLKEDYPYASDMALDLMKRMIQFNPFFRPNIDDILGHPYFTKVRKQHKEKMPSVRVDLEIDKFDRELTFPELKAIILKECDHYKGKREKSGKEFMDK